MFKDGTQFFLLVYILQIRIESGIANKHENVFSNTKT